MGSVLSAFLMVILLSGCNGGSGTDEARPIALPSPTATYEPLNETKNGRFVLKPISAPVEVGVSYRFDLYIHCGVDNTTDFDGSFWDAVGPTESDDSSRRSFEDPVDEGVMTLVSQTRAEYVGSSGEKVEFTRHRGPFATIGCM